MVVVYVIPRFWAHNAHSLLFGCASQAKDGAYEVCPVEGVASMPLELKSYWDARRAQAERPPKSLDPSQRMIVYRHTRYLYRPATRTFVQVE